MTPGDTFVRATGVYAIVALAGSLAAIVPIVRGHAAGLRGNVEVCPLHVGVSDLRIFAKCEARRQMALNGNDRRIGRLSVAELASVTVAIRRVAESEALERKYGGPQRLAA